MIQVAYVSHKCWYALSAIEKSSFPKNSVSDALKEATRLSNASFLLLVLDKELRHTEYAYY